ncbi:MAG TPA: hypothetical protein PLR25_28435, partial [Planctomycetaceae bacterium]|nr:hypothetical protein [Planctomycetaceae bacterium]
QTGGTVAANASEAKVRLSVEKLSNASFAKRQQAAKELLSVGPESVAVLDSLTETSFGETRNRLNVLLPVLRKRLFDDQLAAFLKTPSAEIAERLPQWERYKAICGDDENALRNFGEILNAERLLFATRFFYPRDLPTLLETRTLALEKEFHGRVDEEFPVASVAAVMLLGSESETRLVRTTSYNISRALDDPRFSQLISDGIHKDSLRAIAESWIVRPGIAASRPLLFSMQHNLASGRTVALRIIESKSVRPDIELALLCLAKLDSQQDLSLIESLFADETVLWPRAGQVVKIQGRAAAFTEQTRDVALAVAAYLHGLMPTDIGFSDARTSPTTLFAIDSLGFNSDIARANALAAYRRQTK